MSNQQCWVWGCHNRKGRCVEDVSGNRLCGCRKQHFDSCPRPELLTLHTISKMSASIKRAVTQRINITRQGPEQSRWKASTGAVISNVHYVDLEGPSRKNKNLVPVHFKKPNTTSNPPASKKSRVSTSSEEDTQDTTTGNQDEDLDDDLTLQTESIKRHFCKEFSQILLVQVLLIYSNTYIVRKTQVQY